MATDVYSGLFGSPLSQQELQNQLIEQRAGQMSGMGLGQMGAYLGYKGGAQLGGGLAGLMGKQITDPVVQKAITLRQLAGGIDVSTTEGLQEYAKRLTQAGFQEEAAKIGQQVLAAREKEAKISSEGIVGKLLATGKYTPESIAAFQQSGKSSDLTTVDKFTKPPADFLAKAVELGFGEKTRIGEYTPDQVTKINKAIFDEEINKKAAGAQAIRVDLGSALEKVYLSKDREEAAKRWSEAGKAYEATVPLLNQLDQVEKVLPNAFTGAGAEGKLALSKALGSFGVNIGTRATDTEYVNAISSKVVQQIARVFPGSLAVKELDQLVKSKFNVAQEAPTILRLLGQIRDEMKAQAVTYEQGSKLTDKDRTSFNSSLATGQNMQKINAYRDLENKYRQGTITDAERAQAKALKQELGL